MQHLYRLFHKTLVIENGLVAVFALVIVLCGGGWAIVHFLREDTSPLTNEIARLLNANATLTSKNQELQKLAGAQQAERNQIALIPKFKSERDAAIAERDQAKEALDRLRTESGAVQGRLDQLQQDNHKIKGELDAAIAERDRLRQSLASARTTTPASPLKTTTDNIPAAWKGPRCIEESRGQQCPGWLPVMGHDAPCLPGESRIELYIPPSSPGWNVSGGGRPWCKPS